VIQSAPLAAVHEHPEGVLTKKLLYPPTLVNERLSGWMEYVHGAPPCVTV
jgi:hypothetical protein